MNTAVSDIVGANLEGQRLASHFVESLVTSTAHPDALCQAFADLDSKPDVRRGFARYLQKHLERAAT